MISAKLPFDLRQRFDNDRDGIADAQRWIVKANVDKRKPPRMRIADMLLQKPPDQRRLTDSAGPVNDERRRRNARDLLTRVPKRAGQPLQRRGGCDAHKLSEHIQFFFAPVKMP